MKTYRKGYLAENQLVHKLYELGWAVMRAPRSGKISIPSPDVVAAKKGRILVIEVKSRAAGFQIRREQMEEMKDKLEDNDKARLENEIRNVEDALKTDNVDQIKSATDGLTKAWNEIAPKLYQQAGGPQGQPGPDPTAGAGAGAAGQQATGGEAPKDEKEVEDASYEVVDEDDK
jgi:molecular chaperone DnaK